MAWWGTVIGGTLGYLLGNVLGAMLGAAIGRQFDKGLDNLSGLNAGDTERVQAAFFTATFSVMGHIAKADGQVTHDEIANTEHIMSQMQLSDDQKTVAKNLFSQGKQDDFQLESVLRAFKFECHRRTNLMRMFLEIQISTVLADGKIHPAERKIIYTIADTLGFKRHEIEHIFKVALGIHHPENSRSALKDAYAMLGVSESASDDEIKKAYRRLMKQHHPDKLVAKGMPEEMVKLANEKTIEIRKAYELIKNQRKK